MNCRKLFYTVIYFILQYDGAELGAPKDLQAEALSSSPPAGNREAVVQEMPVDLPVETVALLSPTPGAVKETVAEEDKAVALVSRPHVGQAEPVALVSRPPGGEDEEAAVALVSRHSMAEEFPPDKNAEEADLVGGAGGDITPPSRPSSTPLRQLYIDTTFLFPTSGV